MRYQLVVLGQRGKHYRQELEDSLKDSIMKLGLDPAVYLGILDSSDSVDWSAIPVAVWFGGIGESDPTDLSVLQRFLNERSPVFPVVSDLRHYRESVPSSLHPINGTEWNKDRLVGDILGAFRLTRRERRVFVSYRRSDSRGVAVQMFDLLSQRGWLPFLDTASVEAGREFQVSLWSRMANVDLLILLDSPNALTSQWVYEELARAHDLGLGVLQLIWPSHPRTPGTELSDHIQLEAHDFVTAPVAMESSLTSTTADRVIQQAEVTRIRSLNARRLRVVTDLVDQAQANGLTAVVHPVDGVDFLRNDRKVARAIPIVGIPDAPTIQEVERSMSEEVRLRTRLIYNGLGLDPDWRQHLEWLNARKCLGTFPADDVISWLRNL